MEPKKSFLRALAKSLTRERKARGIAKIDAVASSFSITEKVIFLALLIVFAGAVLSILGKVSDGYSVDVPQHGGSLVEGIVGTPRFVNPLLAVSDADRDLTQLVFSGLLKQDGDSFVPDLAESYTVSPDGLSYTFTIRQNARFHDGTPVTADDVIYTVTEAQDPALKSPRFVNWQGVTVTKTGQKTLEFRLKQPYAPFINNLTLGILPSHIWKAFTADQIPAASNNTAAVGSGPYMIASIVRSADNVPTEFVLKANPNYTLGQPYISNLYIKSFSSEKALSDALRSKAVESASNISPSSAALIASSTSGERIASAPLTRIFGVFFNQNQNEVLAHKEIRKALDMVIDRDALIHDVLQGYGTAIDGPLPPTLDQASVAPAASSSADDASSTLADATKLLTKAGWKKDATTGVFSLKQGKGKTAATTTLAFTISTANIPELVSAAKKLQDAWNAFGAQVDLKVFEPSDLNQSVIRPRKYDALLFGLVTGKNSDLYPFWHSSQRNDPGLNIALYTNQKADKLLEKMRVATSTSALSDEYSQLKSIISDDTPAVFLWNPDFIYAVPAKLRGMSLGEITTSSDRFLGIEKWYVATDHVWSIFAKDQK